MSRPNWIRAEMDVGVARIIQIDTRSPGQNFSYVVALPSGEAWMIDPWDAEPLSLFQREGWVLQGIINTHGHGDHVMGNRAIWQALGSDGIVAAHRDARVPGQNTDLSEGDAIGPFRVWEIPGHTLSHVGLWLGSPEEVCFFSGDTIFNAGVGNCHHGGDPVVLYKTVQRIANDLPDEAFLLPGHDYLKRNLGFTLHYEPGNQAARAWQQSPAFFSRLADEKAFNLFFRVQDKGLWGQLAQQGVVSGEWEPQRFFLALRALRDRY